MNTITASRIIRKGASLATLLRDESTRSVFPELHVRGVVPPAEARFMCVEGARSATGYGEHAAVSLGQDLTEHGFTVVSTGGYGIAAAALRGALYAGGKPVIVSAIGADRAFPPAHENLFEHVVEAGGLIVSPFVDGTIANRTHFGVARELLASVAEAVVVVEGTTRSGTADLAERATAQGRRLFAVPGPINSTLSCLPHQLIRDRHAVLVTAAADIVAAL